MLYALGVKIKGHCELRASDHLKLFVVLDGELFRIIEQEWHRYVEPVHEIKRSRRLSYQTNKSSLLFHSLQPRSGNEADRTKVGPEETCNSAITFLLQPTGHA